MRLCAKFPPVSQDVLTRVVASLKLTRDVCSPLDEFPLIIMLHELNEQTKTWGFEHNTSAKQAITGISYGAPAAIGANGVCADGVLMTMVIVSSTFIKI